MPGWSPSSPRAIPIPRPRWPWSAPCRAPGADVIELGMPFTDPMADGPAIQASSLRALAAGQTMKKTLALVRDFRREDEATPIVLMGYYNPIYQYGVAKFLADAKDAGVDGLIVVDLPPEEDEELCLPAKAAGLAFHPPRHADHRRQAPARRAAQYRGLRLLRLHRRHHRHPLGRRCRYLPGGDAAEAPYRSAGRRRLRHPQRRPGRRRRQGRRWRGGGLGPGRSDRRPSRRRGPRQGEPARRAARPGARAGRGVRGARAS